MIPAATPVALLEQIHNICPIYPFGSWNQSSSVIIPVRGHSGFKHALDKSNAAQKPCKLHTKSQFVPTSQEAVKQHWMIPKQGIWGTKHETWKFFLQSRCWVAHRALLAQPCEILITAVFKGGIAHATLGSWTSKFFHLSFEVFIDVLKHSLLSAFDRETVSINLSMQSVPMFAWNLQWSAAAKMGLLRRATDMFESSRGGSRSCHSI